MSETRPFKPETGAEALEFERGWCTACARHRGGCAVLERASIHDVTDAEYPQEWRIGDDGPECDGFEPKLWRAS